MPAGIQVFNDNGVVQIDGSTPNLVLVAKGQATNSVTFNSPSHPFIFIRPTAGHDIFLIRRGSSYTFSCKGFFQYWAFAEPTLETTANFGFQVFNENGKMVYGSSLAPLRVHSFLSYNKFDFARRTDQTQNWPRAGEEIARLRLPAGRTWAYMPAVPNDVTWPAIFHDAWPYQEVFSVTSDGIRMVLSERGFGFSGGYPMSQTWFANPGLMLVADVTGL